MKKFRLNRTEKRGLRRSVIVAGIITSVILVVAYVDLNFFNNSVPATIDNTGVATSTDQVDSESLGYDTYSNDVYGFSFRYPKILDLRDSQHKATNDFDGLAESSIFVGSFPEGFATGTNLTSATFFAGVKKVNQNTCYNIIYDDSATSTSSRIPQSFFTINGIEYAVVSVSGAGAGSLYTTTRYSTMHDGLCYAFYIVGHSFNDIETYNQDHPDAPVVRYDHLMLDAILGKIIQSFAFTK